MVTKKGVYMAKLGQRIAALTLSVFFLFSAIGFSGLVIWQSHQQNKRDKELAKSATVDNTLKENTLDNQKLENFTPVAQVETLQKIDTVIGTGAEVKPGDTVTAHYTGALAKNGIVFDSSLSRGEPATFPLSGVIKGWQEGVPGMKVGGKRRLLIPASLGYGEQGSPPKIGPNEPLVFDIELVKIGQ
jgi:FKBP-type peptidyl-prolyl cis-trans isomerase